MKSAAIAHPLALREYRSAILSFSALIVCAMILLWVSQGTQFHQLAIGIAMSSITLTLAVALFELCWQIGLRALAYLGSETKNFGSETKN